MPGRSYSCFLCTFLFTTNAFPTQTHFYEVGEMSWIRMSHPSSLLQVFFIPFPSFISYLLKLSLFPFSRMKYKSWLHVLLFESSPLILPRSTGSSLIICLDARVLLLHICFKFNGGCMPIQTQSQSVEVLWF